MRPDLDLQLDSNAPPLSYSRNPPPPPHPRAPLCTLHPPPASLCSAPVPLFFSLQPCCLRSSFFKARLPAVSARARARLSRYRSCQKAALRSSPSPAADAFACRAATATTPPDARCAGHGPPAGISSPRLRPLRWPSYFAACSCAAGLGTAGRSAGMAPAAGLEPAADAAEGPPAVAPAPEADALGPAPAAAGAPPPPWSRASSALSASARLRSASARAPPGPGRSE